MSRAEAREDEVGRAEAADVLAGFVVRGGVLSAALICGATLALGLAGFLSRGPLALVTAGLLALAFAVRRFAPTITVQTLPLWPLAFGLPLALLQTLAVWPLPPTDWDAMTYHVFLPARWLEAGALVSVPMVFGDENPAFAPQNGELIYAWWMGLVSGDTGVVGLQAAALLLLASAVYLLARRFGAGPLAAGLAVAALPWLEPIQRWTFSANVDLFMTAFFVAAAALLLAGARRSDLLFGGLALGLAIGTKTVALPLAAGLAALEAPRLLAAPRRDLLLFAGGAASTGSFWLLRNLYQYGNPLFPLDITLGSWRPLPGMFGTEAMRLSVLHLASFSSWLNGLRQDWGSQTCVFVLAGWAGLALATPSEGREQRWPPLRLAALAVGWALFVWKVVPFNAQYRFLLPSLALAAPGWALLLERLARPRRRVLACGLGLMALASFSRPDQFLLARLRWLTSPQGVRVAALAEADFALWAGGYLPFNETGGERHRIAYSGANVPYALVGPGLRNAVRYCRVQGEEESGSLEFWRRDRARLPFYMPGLYRGQENAETWLACLEKERIDTVVLFWIIPVQVPESWQLDEGFPIERRFMRERPDRFRRVLQSESAEIWAVREWPPSSPGGAGPEGGAAISRAAE